MRTGYKMRWRQRGWTGETTCKAIYDNLDDLLRICRKRNETWRKDGIESWPVKYELDAKSTPLRELEDLRGLVGVGGRPRNGRKRPTITGKAV